MWRRSRGALRAPHSQIGASRARLSRRGTGPGNMSRARPAHRFILLQRRRAFRQLLPQQRQEDLLAVRRRREAVVPVEHRVHAEVITARSV